MNVDWTKVKKYAKYTCYAVAVGGIIYFTGYCRGREDIQKIVMGLNDPLIEIADLLKKGKFNIQHLQDASDLIVSYGSERIDKLLSLMTMAEGSDLLQQAEALGIDASNFMEV